MLGLDAMLCSTAQRVRGVLPIRRSRRGGGREQGQRLGQRGTL